MTPRSQVIITALVKASKNRDQEVTMQINKLLIRQLLYRTISYKLQASTDLSLQPKLNSLNGTYMKIMRFNFNTATTRHQNVCASMQTSKPNDTVLMEFFNLQCILADGQSTYKNQRLKQKI